MLFKITALGSNQYDLNFQIWNSTSGGVLGTIYAEHNLNGVTNSNIGTASTIHTYVSTVGTRMRKIDNFEAILSGGAVIVAEGQPVVSTNVVSAITGNTATSGGNVTDDRGNAVTAKGVCWNTSSSPTIANSKTTDGTGIGTFTSSITGLSVGTLYYARAYATNGSGTSYGEERTFTTISGPSPSITNFNNFYKTYFDGSFSITDPSSNSTGAFSYASDNAAIATISGNTVTITGIGTANITATQAADATYSSGTATVLLTISGINVASKHGGISNTNPNYVDKRGNIGGAIGLSKNGQLLQVKTAEIVSGMALYLDAGNVNSYPGSGTTWTDISGNGNNGTLNNGVGYNSADGGALVFDGANDFFVTNSNLDLSDTDKITIQIILKSSLSNVRIPLEHSTNWNLNNSFGLAFGDTGGKMYVTDHNQGYNTSLTSSSMIDGNWHFFGATLDRSLGDNNQNVVYVDGVLNDGGTISGQTTDNSGNYGNFPLFIGSRAGSSYFFNGKIAHVLIYKRVLTAAEMQQNFNALKARYGL
jgi:hypothetical protein